MKEQVMALYDLQALDIQIDKINTQLAALNSGAELKRKLDAAKAAAASSEKKLFSLETDLKDKELNLKSVDEKRAKYENRLYKGGITNPKELQSIEKEIANLKEQQARLDQQVLELYAAVEEAREKKRYAEEIAGKVEKKIAVISGRESAEKTRLEAELVDTNAKRDSAASAITDKSLLSKYEFVRKRTRNTAVAKIVDGKCEGCHIAILGFTIRNLVVNKELQQCESCGRILFLET